MPGDPVTPPATGPIRVLLVEDNPGDAQLIQVMLHDAQPGAFNVERVDRLATALERVGRAGVDVVLLDLGLPDSEGIETFRRAHRRAAQQPIIVLSGLDNEKVALEAVRSGAQDYHVKGRIEGPLLARVIRYAIERHRTEVELRWLTLAVDQSPASMFITDPRGVIQYVNNRFTEITGYAAAEAIGRTPRILRSGVTPPESYQRLWSTILGGDTWRSEIQNRRKSGELYWDSVVVSPIRDARGQIAHFLAVQEDITQRKDAEQTLRDRDERFSQLADNINEVFFVMDARYRETLYINPAYEKVWGQSCRSLYEQPTSFLNPLPPEDRERVVAYITRVQAGEEPGEVEFRVIRPDGEVRWALAHAVPVRNEGGEVYRIAGVSLDITRRKEAEAAVVASERRLRTLFETVNLVALGLNADGSVDYVNPFFLKLTGYELDAVLGRDWFEHFLPEAQRARVHRAFLEQLEEELHPRYENPIRTKAGEELMISWHNTVLRDAHGRVTGTFSIGEDVTERHRLEDQLRQSQKMEAVGRLAGGVAHDFNNLLTVIFGYADLIGEELPAGSPQNADLEEIRKAARRAAGLTHQLLAFSRRQVLEPIVLSLNELIEDFHKMLRRVIAEDVELRLVLAPGAGNVRADPGQLQQVIMNLAVNAHDAMPTGGKLVIETANADLSEQYAEVHHPVVPGRYVMLAVTDTGVGMGTEVKSQIFEPFFTTKAKGKGTGLGLSTVYGIIKQSGGYVWVYSEPGHGTTFKIYLPRVDAPAHAPLPQPEVETLTGTETILLAEDDDTLRRLSKGLLEKAGYTVIEAENAARAVAVARAYEGAIHLLVADVVMPGGSGRDLARQLAESRPNAKVLYVSGYTDDAIVHHGMLEPGLNFLQKPFTPAALARKVRAVLDAK
jgi:two-component system cell cycle sensor histidine kinase/response regulator CckA